MLKKRAFFWWGIVLCLLLVFAWGYHLYTKPHQSAGSEDSAFSIDADSLFIQYQRDEHGADSKYLGKVIEVKGKIAEIQHNGPSEIWILSAEPGGAGGVNCQLFAGEKGPQHHTGDLVSLKGRCTGFLMDVNLVDCVSK
jgi:putative nucleic acid binding protein